LNPKNQPQIAPMSADQNSIEGDPPEICGIRVIRG
jgi:hypothetical protein